MASMNTRLNIEKLDGNIVQKHGGSKQVGFKQLGPGVETGVHGVHDEKRVWFEVELQGAQGDLEAEVFQVSNDDTAMAQRRLKDKQPEEKTNTNCLVKEHEREYQTGWKIKTGNVLDSCNQRSTQQCTKSGVAKHLGVASGLSKVFWAEDTTMSTYLVTRSPSSSIGFKTPVDMLGFFGWLAIKQGILEPVKEEYGVSMKWQYWKLSLWFGVVAAVDKVYAHESLTFNNTIAYEVISKWKVGLKDDMDARSDVYVLSNGCRKSRDDSHDYYWKYAPGMFIHLFLYIDDMVFSCGCKAEIWATKGLLDKAMENVLGMEIVRDQSGDCDVEKNGYELSYYAIVKAVHGPRGPSTGQ
ncbi:hypothetical protein Tco_0817033 [Tanacetum coccineum]